MKTLILILTLFSCGLMSQEYEYKYSDKWVDYGIWQIPQGVDTSMLKNEWMELAINDSIVSGYFRLHPEKEIKQLNVNDSIFWRNKNKYRWMVYENMARQVQVLIRERKRIDKQIPKEELEANLKYNEIINALKQGHKPEQIKRYIDSVYYK